MFTKSQLGTVTDLYVGDKVVVLLDGPGPGTEESLLRYGRALVGTVTWVGQETFSAEVLIDERFYSVWEVLAPDDDFDYEAGTTMEVIFDAPIRNVLTVVRGEVTVLAHVHIKMRSDWTEEQVAELLELVDGCEFIMAEEI